MIKDSKGGTHLRSCPQLAGVVNSFASLPAEAPSSVLRAARLGDALWSELADLLGDGVLVQSLQDVVDGDTVSEAELRKLKASLKTHWEKAPAEKQGVVMFFYHLVIARAYGLHGVWISSRARAETVPIYESIALILRQTGFSRVWVDACRRYRQSEHSLGENL